MKYIELSNEILSPLYINLSRLTLSEKNSSARRRFLRAIRPLVVEKEESVDAANKKYADKDADNKPKIVNDRYVYTEENRKKLNSDVAEINSVIVKFDVLPSNEMDIKTVASILSEEAEKYKTEKKSEFNAADFDYYQTLIDCSNMLLDVKESK